MSTSNQTFRGKAAPETGGSSFNKEISTSATPGSEIDVISETVGSGKRINLLQIFVSYRLEGKWRVLIDSRQIGSGHTGPGKGDPSGISWSPYEPATEGQVIKVKFEAMNGRPADTIDAYLQAREVNL